MLLHVSIKLIEILNNECQLKLTNDLTLSLFISSHVLFIWLLFSVTQTVSMCEKRLWSSKLFCVLPLFPPLLPSLPGVEDRGRKRCLCLNEAKIGSRVALQRNRQIIPTPSVCVCVGNGWGGRWGRERQNFSIWGATNKTSNAIPPKTHTGRYPLRGKNMLLIPRRRAESNRSLVTTLSSVNSSAAARKKIISHPTGSSHS